MLKSWSLRGKDKLSKGLSFLFNAILSKRSSMAEEAAPETELTTPGADPVNMTSLELSMSDNDRVAVSISGTAGTSGVSSFDPTPGRLFGLRVLELKEQGVTEEDAIGVANMEYLTEKKAKKKAYSRLKQIAKLQGKKPPPNPFPSAIKEVQAEERKFVRERFSNRDILNIVEQMKKEKDAFRQERTPQPED